MKLTHALMTVGALGLVAGTTPLASAATVQTGYSPTATQYGQTRLREFGNHNDREVYVGVPSLGSKNHRVELDLRWDSANYLTFSYDAAGDALTTSLDLGNDGSVDHQLVYGNWSSEALSITADDPTLLPMNYLQIDIAAREKDSTIALSDVLLDGHALGTFTGDGGWDNWNVTGIDLSGGFEFSGLLTLSGVTSGSAEKNKVQVGFGHDPQAPVPVPEPATLIALGFFGLLIRRF
jgi:hypothetical protein